MSVADLDLEVARLSGVLGERAGLAAIAAMLKAGYGRDRLAVVSSFGAESALLLAMVADIDAGLPVLFLDTGKHFPETLAYRDRLAAQLGLGDVRVITPDADALADADASGDLWSRDPDACCGLRKVAPLDRALAGFDAWITGRKRYHGGGRADLPVVEHDGHHIKLNPLAPYSADEIASEWERRGLPEHPLTASGYVSIGCAPCSVPAHRAQGARAGRWAGCAKTECGIHTRGATSSIASSARGASG